MNLDERTINLIWAAGFIDGEGCITATIRNDRNYYRVQLTVTQVDPYPLIVLQQLWGGKIFTYCRAGKGKYPNSAPYYLWAVSGNALPPVCKEILPYLKLKRHQAQLAIEFSETHNRRGVGNRWNPLTAEAKCKRAEIAELLHTLNRKGIPRNSRNIVLPQRPTTTQPSMLG